MNLTSLLSDLRDRGIRLEANDGKIRCSPKSVMTAELRRRIKAHKPELLSILTAENPAVEKAYHAAIDRLVHEDNTSEYNALLEKCRGALTDANPRERHVACPRCGSNDFVDVPIHDGRSTRRDCTECGKFIEFPTWKN